MTIWTKRSPCLRHGVHRAYRKQVWFVKVLYSQVSKGICWNNLQTFCFRGAVTALVARDVVYLKCTQRLDTHYLFCLLWSLCHYYIIMRIRMLVMTLLLLMLLLLLLMIRDDHDEEQEGRSRRGVPRGWGLVFDMVTVTCFYDVILDIICREVIFV